jgi:hypothetical protein
MTDLRSTPWKIFSIWGTIGVTRKLPINPMPDLEYLTDSTGIPTAVVIPIALWRQLLPHEDASQEAIGEALEDYCLNRAIDEGKQTPLLTRAEALAYLEE